MPSVMKIKKRIICGIYAQETNYFKHIFHLTLTLNVQTKFIFAIHRLIMVYTCPKVIFNKVMLNKLREQIFHLSFATDLGHMCDTLYCYGGDLSLVL